jgi:hypothetical protein
MNGRSRNRADTQELEKLISYSATPTAVWRRTGEICYANPEFCSLAKRNEGDLLQGQRDGEKQYIYQLFSKPSYVPPSSSSPQFHFSMPIPVNTPVRRIKVKSRRRRAVKIGEGIDDGDES